MGGVGRREEGRGGEGRERREEGEEGRGEEDLHYECDYVKHCMSIIICVCVCVCVTCSSVCCVYVCVCVVCCVTCSSVCCVYVCVCVVCCVSTHLRPSQRAGCLGEETVIGQSSAHPSHVQQLPNPEDGGEPYLGPAIP